MTSSSALSHDLDKLRVERLHGMFQTASRPAREAIRRYVDTLQQGCHHVTISGHPSILRDSFLNPCRRQLADMRNELTMFFRRCISNTVWAKNRATRRVILN